MPDRKIKIRSKLWLMDEDGRVFFGRGRFQILETVERRGSRQEDP